ncbi:MAG: molybdenum cofactor guanylyltransferase [Planctomycetes bacterium]|nr:molybdenum cofactor guanylyltransferase [Planctomycetota bacterium]
MRHSVTCGILAGGASARMGQDKALLPFHGRPLLQHQIELLSPMFKEVLLGANDPAPYTSFGVRVVPDLLPERCALTGIHAILKAAVRPRVFVVACDMPFLNPALIEKLFAVPGEPDVVVPESDRGLEPLHAFYGPWCVKAIEECARRGVWKVTDFYASLRVERVRIKDSDWLVDGQSPFLNANTPDEWRTIAP